MGLAPSSRQVILQEWKGKLGEPALHEIIGALDQVVDGPTMLMSLTASDGTTPRADLELALRLLGVAKGAYEAATQSFDELSVDGRLNVRTWWCEKLLPRTKIIVDSRIRMQRPTAWDLTAALYVADMFCTASNRATRSIERLQLRAVLQDFGLDDSALDECFADVAPSGSVVLRTWRDHLSERATHAVVAALDSIVDAPPILAALADSAGNVPRADLELGLKLLGVAKGVYDGATRSFAELDLAGGVNVRTWWCVKLPPKTKVIVDSRLRALRPDLWDLGAAISVANLFGAASVRLGRSVTGGQLRAVLKELGLDDSALEECTSDVAPGTSVILREWRQTLAASTLHAIVLALDGVIDGPTMLMGLAGADGTMARADLERALRLLGIAKGVYEGATQSFDEMDVGGKVNVRTWWCEKLLPKTKVSRDALRTRKP